MDIEEWKLDIDFDKAKDDGLIPPGWLTRPHLPVRGSSLCSTASVSSPPTSPYAESVNASVFSDVSTSTYLTVPEFTRTRSSSRSRAHDGQRLPEWKPQQRGTLRINGPSVLSLELPMRAWKERAPFPDLPDEILIEITRRVADPRRRGKHSHIIRDLYALMLVSKQWRFAAKASMYHTLYLPVSQLQSQPRKFLFKSRSSVSLLHRTLVECPILADAVREIHVTDHKGTVQGEKEVVAMCDNLTSLISECSHLERIVGFYPQYHHKHEGYFRALASKQQLKSHSWILGGVIAERGSEKKRFFRQANNTKPLLQQALTASFVGFHSEFEHLETLVLTCVSGTMCQEDIRSVFKRLPALKQLELSALSAQDFNTSDLTRLPQTLHSLRLDSLPGIREQGLVDYFTKEMTFAQRRNFRSVSLLNIKLDAVSSVGAILESLFNLKRFVLCTDMLTLSADEGFLPMQDALLSSRSLKHLHWDLMDNNHAGCDAGSQLRKSGTEATCANKLLAESIRAGGFPELRSVCSPTDPDGIIQGVCRPVPRPVYRAATMNALPSPFGGDHDFNDQFSPYEAPLILRATSRQMTNSTDSSMTWSSRSDSQMSEHERCTSSTTAAYHRAAEAISIPRQQGHDVEGGFRYSKLSGVEPYISVHITDPDGNLEGIYEFPKFLGRVAVHGVPEYVLLQTMLPPSEGVEAVAHSGTGLINFDTVVRSGAKWDIRALF